MSEDQSVQNFFPKDLKFNSDDATVNINSCSTILYITTNNGLFLRMKKTTQWLEKENNSLSC